VHPFQLTQNISILDNILVRRQEHLELPSSNLALQRPADSGRPFVDESRNRRRPLLELHRPIGQSRERDNDEIRPGLTLTFNQERNERYGLNGFSQSLNVPKQK